jgi:hypothetical protein
MPQCTPPSATANKKFLYTGKKFALNLIKFLKKPMKKQKHVSKCEAEHRMRKLPVRLKE